MPGVEQVAAEHAPGVDRGPGVGREPGDSRAPAAEWQPATEPDWSGPNWNRPSWGGGWAPPWSREESEPAGRRAWDEPAATGRRSRAEDEPVGRRAREEDEPVGRRSREDRASGWTAEPHRPYEPPRAEPPGRSYEPPRAEPGRPYEVGRTESAPRPAYEPPADPADRAASPAADRSVPVPAERPAWAGGAPASAPPAAYDLAGTAEGTTAAPAGDETAGPTARPFRLRPVSEERPPASPEASGGPQAASGPAATVATSGPGRRDRIPSAPAPTSAPPYAARRSAPEPASTAEPAGDDRLPDRPPAVLPQRVPAEPDVPVVPEPPAVEPPAETPELARIATHLRRDDEPAPLRERPEGFDVNAILDAVRGVAGVRDAALRRTPAGAHSLRLDLADGADPAEVSRLVARLLQERMGLAAAPQNVPGMPAAPAPPVRRRSAEPRAAETRSPGSAGPRSAEPPAAETRVPGSRAVGTPTEAPQARAEQRPEAAPEPPRRRRQSAAPHRGRATVEEPGSVSAAPAGTPTGSPATVGTSYSGGQVTTTESAPSRPLDTGGAAGPRVVIDHVQVSTFGLDATVEVRLVAGGESAAGYSTGPAVDGYVLRLCAVAAAAAVDELLRGGDPGPERGRCFVEHAAVVPFGNCEVATVVVLLVCDGWVEQLVGSALVAGDPRQAVVRATLAAVNRRIEALLA
ncbi:hypothetical protein ACGF5C_04170 [Micromonospora sp. NPDC047620]|uniref:hypothetical protein n=1 Tax=Micromonospora sp. NPDC047620 TaxID=3364251 RepID=UPI00371DEE71